MAHFNRMEFDVFELLTFDGFELLSICGSPPKRLAKVQDSSPAYKVLSLLFGSDGEKKKFVHLSDIFERVPEGKRMDKIIDGLQMDSEIRKLAFKCDSQKVRLNAKVDIIRLMKQIPYDRNSPIIKFCEKAYGIQEAVE